MSSAISALNFFIFSLVDASYAHWAEMKLEVASNFFPSTVEF